MRSFTMAPHYTSVSRLALLLSALVLLQGCAWLMPPPQDDQLARQWVTQWASHNADLEPTKGLMRIEIISGGRITSGRAAWAAAHPDRLRLEWLSALGQPLMSLAGDGKTITLYSSADQTYRRFAQSRTALERLIRIPIGIEDLIDVLAGRPPLPEYAAARLAPGPGIGVVLESRWHILLAQLQSDGSRRLHSMTAYDPQGGVQYRIDWLQWDTFDEYTIPREVRLTSGTGDQLTLRIDRFYTDTELPPETFVIAPPP
jgi:outer membrane biogenesis lipoprotein LolB